MTAPIPPLFGGPVRSAGAPAAQSGPLHLVEFRAGRMTLRDRMVTPDRRKGLIYVIQSDDGLAHFCWKDRSSGTVEEDLIIFPDDVTFSLLPATQCRGGRVFLLRFKSNPARKFFFWSQESKADADESLCERVTEALNNPTAVLAGLMAARSGSSEAPSSSRNADNLLPPGAVSPLGGTFTEADLQALLGAYSPQQLLSWMNSGANSRPTSAGGLGAATPFGIGAAAAAAAAAAGSSSSTSQDPQPATTSSSSTTTSAPTTSLPPSTPANTTAPSASNGNAPRRPGPADLAAALRAIGATMSQGKSASSSAAGGGSSNLPLSDILSADAVIGSATAPGTVTDRLVAHLPPGTGLPGDEELIASLRSPQFQQAANMLSAALETGQLGPLLIEMGVAREAVAGVHDVESFLRALQQHAPSTPAQTPVSSANGTAAGATNGAPSKTAATKKDEAATNGAKKKDSNGDGAGTGSSPMEH